jgi:hypothetical protein
METSLHRELKALYGGPDARREARHGRYRIDVIDGDELIEIQHASLASIRDKVRDLLSGHRVRIVKPIVASKLLVKRRRKGGAVVERRMSPKRGRLLDIFDELVYFTRVFPHRRLTIELVSVEIEEWRYPGHGRRRRYGERDFEVEDQILVSRGATWQLQTAADLLALAETPLPATFKTDELAECLQVPRWLAQRIAYCWRETGAVVCAGKCGNAHVYAPAKPRRARRRSA